MKSWTIIKLSYLVFRALKHLNQGLLSRQVTKLCRTFSWPVRALTTVKSKALFEINTEFVQNYISIFS